MPNLIGTAPNQVPVNGLLGTLAFQDSSSVTISGGSIGGVPVFSLAASVLQGEQLDTIASSSSLVLRGGATNLLTYSEQIDNAAWNKGNVTISANASVAPDGTLNGDTITANTTNSTHSISKTGVVITSATDYTFTFYVKANGKQWVVLQYTTGFSASHASYFNVADGSLGNVLNTPTARSITSVGNGWYRCSITATSTATSLNAVLYVADSNGSVTFAGDGVSGVHVWGAQLEAASTAGAYLKTEATAVSTAYAAPIESPNGVAVPLLTSMTPARNGDMTFQLTSNTSLTIKVKGSDGTVRSVALTLA